VKQKEQYEKAAEKLEDQLLKLKEQREALKLQGQKHEDTIMKENAKLQKEVKYRITYMKDYMVKIEAGLADDAKLQAEMKERRRLDEERMWREQEERRAEEESRDKKAKKKKKTKSRDPSSSPSEDDSERKRRKKAKKRSSASESSDEEGKGRRKKDSGASMEEDVFRMVAEMKSRKKKGGGLGENDVLVDMMGRMSESYSKLKKTNEELSDRCTSLEGQNKTLMKRVEELEAELRGDQQPPPPPPRAPTPEKRERRSRFNKIEDRDEEEKKERERSERRRREEAEEERERSERRRREEPAPEDEMRSSRRRFEEPPSEEPPVRERRRWDDSRGEDRARSPRGGDERREERTRSPRDERREERRSSPGRNSRAPPARDSRPPPGVPIAANPNAEPLAPRRGGGGSGLAGVLALAGGYVAPPPNMVQPPPAMVPPPPTAVESAREEINRKLEERLEEKRRGRTSGRGEERSRSRSKERRRGRDRSNERSSDRKERGSDEFNLGEWVKKPSTQREEGLAGLREKLKEARDEETRKDDEMKSRWGAREPIGPPPVPPPTGPPPGGLAENRSSVAMSWGSVQKTGNRASADRASAERGIKVAPIVGKMPWAKGTVGGRKSKFGPPVEGGVPPPSIVTSQPTLQAAPGGQDPPHQDWGPPPGIRSDWGNMNAYQPPAMPSWGSHNYGYGSEGGDQEGPPGPPLPPVPVQEPKKAGRNQAINPKPSAPIDMATMLAAAQQHMQKSLATKLESIGVPLPGHLRKEAGLTRGVESYEVPEAIPLPGDQSGVDMSIADIAPPQEHIPMPPGAGGEYDDIAEPEPQNQEFGQQQQQQQTEEAQYQEYNQQEYYQQEYNQYQAYHQAPQESSAPAPPGELAPPGDPAPPGDDDDCRPPGED